MQIIRWILAAILVVALVWAAIGYTVDRAVDRVVLREAVDKAEHWGEYMSERLPDLEKLVETGVPTEEQLEIIQQIRRLGDIFRFKLFSSEGRLALVSDDEHRAGTGGLADEIDPEPFEVIETGGARVDVFDGSARPDRPDLYAEAYLPLTGADGQVAGVIEVYVDQTVTRQYFVESFSSFGLVLTLFCALVFAVPGLAFVLQRFWAKRSRKEADFLARFDPLTGLSNRKDFVAEAGQHLAAGELTFVCYLDVDRFKVINDTHGHAVGDAFLVHIARVLRKKCAPDDLLARFGGDEFVVGIRKGSLEDASRIARGILKECSDEVDVQGNTIFGGVSIGIAEIGADTSLDKALSNADAALYHAKSAGRNDFAIYGDEMGEELAKRHALEARLRVATRDCDFEVHYQPLVDGTTRKTVGYEALLRLSETDGTPIPPSVFIPFAEELGLIDKIGEWTLRTGMREVASLGGDEMLAVNLSTVQFRSGGLVNTVREALQQTGFPANRLELEITESLLFEDSPTVEMQIDSLREMGIKIAMDDFGTGFSSLSYLWKYGFDRLKIDRSFVAALEESPERSREIIETVVMLGSRLDMKVTAEGVETSGQSRLLSSLGCDILQGYLFGKGEPLETVQKEILANVAGPDENVG